MDRPVEAVGNGTISQERNLGWHGPPMYLLPVDMIRNHGKEVPPAGSYRFERHGGSLAAMTAFGRDNHS